MKSRGGNKSIALQSALHRAHGRITTPGGRPAPGVPVQAFDRTLRSERLLGEGSTDEKGKYEIHYSPDRGNGSLVVRALPQNAPPVDSPILFDAGPDETIDLTVALPDPSEYETLLEEVERLCEGVPIAELRQDKDHQDLSFLAGETGRSETHIAFLILAHRHAESPGLPAAALYGLFRDGMPTGLVALREKSPQHLEDALREAARKNIVPAQIGDDARAIARKIARRQASRRASSRKASKTLEFGSEAQHLLRIAPEHRERKHLKDHGLESAQAIARYSRNAFVDQHGEALGVERAGRIHDRSSQIAATALILASDLAPSFRGPAIRAIDGGSPAAMTEDVPDWETLFGSADFCACEHCRSVYSPAAYLVDILDFLKDRKLDTAGTTALSVLLERRPDLGEIRLTCENTNTPLPYVDLVNEILESAVKPSTAVAAKDRQTTGTADELAADPQHVNPGAYDELRKAVFPWNLPFDLGWEECRTHLGHLGVPRHELLETLRTTTVSDLEIAGERLGFPVTERKIVTGEALSPAVDPWKYYGFADEASLNTWIARVSGTETTSAKPYGIRLFLDRTGLTLDELDRLLELRFVNPAPKMEVQPKDPAKPTCDTNELVLRNLNAAALGRLHRFVRLWRRLGWPMRDVDRAIAALRAGAIDKELLTELAVLQRLAAELGLPLSRLLAFYAPLALGTFEYSGADDRPFYDQLFLNPVAGRLNPGETSPFALNEARSELALVTAAGAKPTLDDPKVAALLRGALGLTADELAALIAGTDSPLQTRELRLSNLTRVARCVLLARALRLRIADFLRLVKLSGIDPFSQLPDDLGTRTAVAPEVPARTLAFVDTAGQLAKAGFTVAEVDVLLAGRSDPASPATPSDEELARVLEGLRTALAKAPVSNLESLALQQLGSIQGLAPAVTQELLGTWLRSRSDASRPLISDLVAADFLASSRRVTRDAFPGPMNALSLAHRAAFVVSRLRIGARQLPWAIGRARAAGWLDLNTLPLESVDAAAAFEKWMRLLDLVRLRDGLPDGETALTRIFTLADKTGTTPDELKKLEELVAEAADWAANDVETLDAAFGFTLPGAFRNEQALLRLQTAMALLGRLGVAADRALTWRRMEPGQDETRDIRQAARARLGEKGWLAAARLLRDVLRERQRQSLVAWLVARPGSGQTWKDANGLFRHFLIDVEMSPCQLTSRLKQAISSVQLFVQRCLMHLEPRIQADAKKDPHWKEWTTMKSYRVWEASRKVFLYPESYLDPELRDDKSPFCKDLESELLQRELTDEAAEEALLHYLEQLDTVAHLDVQGVYHQVQPEVDILHVFARTRHTPHRYFHRTRVDGYRWTPWQAIDVDIQGDHLIPILWNRRLYLLWAVFTLDNTSKQISVSEGKPVEEPEKYWRIQLAWTQLVSGKWQPKKITRGNLVTTAGTQAPPQSAIRFWPGVHETRGDLKVFVAETQAGSPVKLSSRGYFVFTSCHGLVLTVEDVRPVDSLDLPKRTVPWGMELIEAKEAGETEEPLYLGVDTSTKALAKTPFLPGFPSPFHLLVSARIDEGTVFGNVFQSPFFFSDQERTLFVEPTSPAAATAAVERAALRDPANLALADEALPPIVIHPPAGPVQTQGLESLLRPPIPGDHVTASAAATRVLAGLPRAARLLAGDSTDLRRLTAASGTGPAFRFSTFRHPYACLFQRELNRLGVDGLLTRQIQDKPWDVEGNDRFSFSETYGPTGLVDPRYPAEDVDFDPRGSYSLYNWELFFYIPLTIAVRLSRNQRFEEAQRWFHRIFDPTDLSAEPVPQRHWQTRPFFNTAKETYRPQRIEELLRKLASGSPDEDLAQSVLDWRKNPFNPHTVARLRTTAYQKAVVMSYLDHLIAWGDQLFRRDTLESLNEATQIYVLAAEILGRRPERIKSRETASPPTYNELSTAPAGPVAMAELLVPEAGEGLAAVEADLPPPPRFLLSTFCVPPNDKLLGYWDLVGDRLFKLRHCLNVEGVERQLALFEPPIDPSLLVRAAAAGLDLGRVLADATPALPCYRFNTMLAKANELCAEVKALGAALLAALEKRDAETLALLRSSQENRVLAAAREVRQKQIDEATEALEGLKASRKLAEKRFEYYASQQFMKPGEQEQADKAKDAGNLQAAAAAADWLASIVHIIPSFKVGSPFSIGVTFGGNDIGGSAKGVAGSLGVTSGALSAFGAQAGTMAGYDRRQEEWQHQTELAVREMTQIDRQIAAADVRLAVAQKELDNHDLQIENARDVEAFLQDKYTSGELYNWMVAQISGVYFQAYQLAYDVAKRAERSYQFELVRDTSFVQLGSWDTLRKGLLAGEKLALDLKRMEISYLEENRREYEITSRISLALHNPAALATLKTTGECFVDLPETVFDRLTPGHFMRRIKSVGLTIPCVAGPYTGVHCTLTLHKHSIRRSGILLDNQYARQEDGKETRFTDSSGALQSIVTSGAIEDSGLFETSLQDARYLPFEGAGAISKWHLQLPPDAIKTFEYSTISDVVFLVRHTAREGGAILRNAAVAALPPKP